MVDLSLLNRQMVLLLRRLDKSSDQRVEFLTRIGVCGENSLAALPAPLEQVERETLGGLTGWLLRLRLNPVRFAACDLYHNHFR